MKAANWYTFFKFSFGIGGVLFFASVIAAFYGRSGGFYQDFGLVGLLVSVFLFLSAYVAYQRYKQESKLKSSKKIIFADMLHFSVDLCSRDQPLSEYPNLQNRNSNYKSKVH